MEIGCLKLESQKVPSTFVCRFVFVAAILLALYYFPYAGAGVNLLFNLYLSTYAHLAGAAISLFDPSVHVVGTRIIGRMTMDFALSCDAMDVYILFAAATVAFPTRWRRRAIALVFSFAAMVCLNVLRILSLFYLGMYFPSKFDLFHLQIWPAVIVMVASAAFLGWARSIRPERPKVEGHATDVVHDA
jgi:exosortase/archaeosortase family protein